MTTKAKQKKNSPCEKLRAMMRSILKLSLVSMVERNVSSTSSPSPPHGYPKTKQPDNLMLQSLNRLYPSKQEDEVRGGEGHSIIQIQGVDDRGNGRSSGSLNGMNELKASITNLKFTDYIRRFHEKNKHESVLMVLPPPPQPPPVLFRRRFSSHD